jgi:hypothetical protein
MVAPIVQNMQRGFELSGDGRSRFADDVGGDAGTAARVLVRFEQGVRFRVDIADLDYPPTYLDRFGKLQV